MDYYDLDKTKTFLVSQKALLVEDDRLLILRGLAERADSEALWDLPGGLLEMEEAFEAGLKREVKEETNLEISIGTIISTWDHRLGAFTFKDGRTLNVRLIVLAFLCEKKRGIIRLSDEHSQYKWATADELTALRFAPNAHPAVQAYLNQPTFRVRH